MSKKNKETIDIQTEYDQYELNGYLCEFSSRGCIPLTRFNQDKQRNFFNCHQKTKPLSVYDQIFRIKWDFNPKAHRDDRKHSKFLGLNILQEEKEKVCPSRSSSEYGRRSDECFHFDERSHGKIDHVKKDFYRNNVWNNEFPQFQSNHLAAINSVENEGDPYQFNYDHIGDSLTWAYRRTPYQLKRISNLFKTIFGNANVGPWKRVRPILAGQAVNPYIIQTGFNYLNTIYGSPTNFFHGIAIAPYLDLGDDRTRSNLTVDEVLDRGPDTAAGCGRCSLEAKINATRDPRLTDLCVEYLNGWYQYGSWNFLEDMRQEILIDTTTMFNATSTTIT